jgi:hypothetical protein
LLVAAALWAGWEAFITLTVPRRLAPDLAVAREANARVAVTLGFAPEEFHIRLFQTYGVVSGVRGTTVLLDRVSPDDVQRLARHYWIKRIERRS